ncbi:putative AC9 transposase [Bienertia sinuspersici]
MHGKERGMKLANDVKEFTYALFDEYRSMYSFVTPQSGQCGDSMSIDIDVDGESMEGGNDYIKNLGDRAKRLKGSSGNVISELDRYLNDQLGPEEEELDTLAWWGSNGHRYPVLNHMARDILAIPLSTVASESTFSTGGHTLDPFRSSLTPKVMPLHLLIFVIKFVCIIVYI